jgi:hypothetical protein
MNEADEQNDNKIFYIIIHHIRTSTSNIIYDIARPQFYLFITFIGLLILYYIGLL